MTWFANIAPRFQYFLKILLKYYCKQKIASMTQALIHKDIFLQTPCSTVYLISTHPVQHSFYFIKCRAVLEIPPLRFVFNH